MGVEQLPGNGWVGGSASLFDSGGDIGGMGVGEGGAEEVSAFCGGGWGKGGFGEK